MMENEAARLADVEQRIARAAGMAGRAVDAITLIAVSKTQSAAAIAPLIVAGVTDFGENRVQEAEEKWPALIAAHPQLRLHMIGQLQSNKAEAAVRMAHAIHSVDRPSLVAALARAMDKAGRRPECFIQVNLEGAAQKGGCPPEELAALLAAARVADLPVVGLMTVPPQGLEPSPWFALLAKLACDHGLAGLSMGMSGDYEAAVKLGATHVRVGSALFGERG
jgi:PLP dependent protein